MESIQEVTYLTTQGDRRTGYYEGMMQKQTGELLITDTLTGRQVFVQPARVTFPND